MGSAKDYVKEFNPHLSSLRQAELEAMMVEFAMQEVEKIINE